MLEELIGDAGRAAVLERMEAATHAELARFRELTALVRGTGPPPARAEEFARVVAALRAEPAG